MTDVYENHQIYKLTSKEAKFGGFVRDKVFCRIQILISKITKLRNKGMELNLQAWAACINNNNNKIFIFRRLHIKYRYLSNIWSY